MNRRIALVFVAVLSETLLLASAAAAVAGADEPPGSIDSLADARSLLTAAKYAEAEDLLRRTAEAQKEADPSSAHYAATLDLLGVLYTALGKYSQADACLIEAAAILRQLSEKRAAYAETLTHRAKALELRADYATAETLIKESLSLLAQSKLDKRNGYAAALVVLADLEWDKGRYTEARGSYSRAIKLFEADDAAETEECATAQNNLGRLNRSLNPAKADELIRAAMATRKNLFGEQHPAYANSLNSLATLLQSQGKSSEAEHCLRKSLEIYKTSLGEGHPNYASTLNALANLYRDEGKYTEAGEQALLAVEICERALGSTHPVYAAALNNLALVNLLQADYVAAERAFTEAMSVYDKVFDRGHPQRLTVRDNLAGLYEAEGDHRRAIQIFEQQRHARQSSATSDPLGYARWLAAMAGVQRKQHNRDDAENLLALALAALTKFQGREVDLERANILEEQADLHRVPRPQSPPKKGLVQANGQRKTDAQRKAERHREADDQFKKDLAKADANLKNALDIRERHLGKDHPLYAAALERQAGLYQTLATVYPSEATRYYVAAERHYRRVLEIRETCLGKENPEYAAALTNLASVHRAQGKNQEAAADFKKALNITRNFLNKTAASQSEQQQLATTQTARLYLDQYLSLMVGLPAPCDDLYSEVLAWKGAVSRRQQMMRAMRRALAEGDPEIAGLYQELETAARRLARFSHAERKPGDEVTEGRELDALGEQVERLQRDLAAKSADFRREIESRSRTPDDIRQALTDKIVLVDLLEYWHFPKFGNSPQALVPTRRLIAFVVRRDRPTELIDLGPAIAIDQAVNEWIVDLKRPGTKDSAALLRQLLWSPLESHVADAETVLISPDGATAWLPWGALPAKEPGKFLIESQSFAMLPVPQMLPDIMASDATFSGDCPTLLAVGDIDYGAAPGKADVTSGKRSAMRGRGDLRYGWRKLAATEAEITQVADSFSQAFPDAPTVTPLRGSSATEEAVRTKAPRHRFLHFATHGFFAPPQVASASRGLSSADLAPGERAARSEIAGFHPGLLSGIVLAGANHPERLDEDDGILTALEIEQLGLSGVELVTLSACQTGIGNTVSGEGLLSLQRAFQVAGASSVLASLWSVDDEQTARLMAAFYENLWKKKLSRAEALRKAQIDMLNDEALRGRVASTKSSDKNQRGRGMEFSTPRPGKNQRVPPFYWAAFVLSGDWR
ncbi:MAG TPA: CHAT domain-containing tetratricopeptide repeat protein [Pirellulales bacterium]|nr:CHAT domain-containing tetratricopeptide repeat protein [Pirellulales bacterium]